MALRNWRHLKWALKEGQDFARGVMRKTISKEETQWHGESGVHCLQLMWGLAVNRGQKMEESL